MGMFDYVSFDAEGAKLLEWPKSCSIPYSPELEWQSKDFENIMTRYRIGKDGVIEQEVVDGKWIPNPEKDDGRRFYLSSIFEETSRRWIPYTAHGAKYVYCYHSTEEPLNLDICIEYSLLYDAGKLISVRLVEHTETSNIERRKRLSEIVNRPPPSTYQKIKRRVLSIIAAQVYKLCNVLQNLHIWIIRQ